MKHTLLTFLLVLSSIPFYGQWWEPQISGVASNLNDVYCITSNMVVAIGDAGTILKTTDGGAHWLQKSSGTTLALRKLQFVNNTTAYAVGEAGTILKTIDGGESWSAIASGTTANLLGLSALDESTFYVSGSDGLIKRTHDGGATFTNQSYGQNHAFKNIQILDALTAYALSYDYYGSDLNAFIKTTDGGLTWVPISDRNTSYFYFMNENTGFIKDSSGFHKTIDGGQTWTDLSVYSEGNTVDMFAVNENKLWQVENNYTLCNCSFFCIRKTGLNDGPSPVETQNCYADTNGALPFEAIHFANETTGFVVGWGGKILKNATGNMENLAVNEFDQKDFVKIYPNPSSGLVNLSFEEKHNEPFSIEIADILGKKMVVQSYANQNDATVNIESLSGGVYFLKLQSGNGSTTQKLIKR